MKILVAALADGSSNPRPNRMISCLKDYANVTFLGYGEVSYDNVDFIEIQPQKISIFAKFIKLFLLKLGFEKDYLDYVVSGSVIEELSKYKFDVIICHDLLLLHFLKCAKVSGPIVFDAREFYPKQFENRFLWRFLLQNFNEKLCYAHLPNTDYCFTVSEGLAEKYLSDYQTGMEVLYSLPEKAQCKPSKIRRNNIRIIHHGIANPSRRLESMIRCMDFVDDRFALDLMLVGCGSRYYRLIEKQIRKRHNVRLIPPVPFEKIVSFSNEYDIGLFLVPPSTYNLKHCMPNKFFEFIQARLAVAVGPSPDMAQFVKKYDIGVVSRDFTPQSMAHELNSLSIEKIHCHKMQSDKIACNYTADRNKKRLIELFDFYRKFHTFSQ